MCCEHGRFCAEVFFLCAIHNRSNFHSLSVTYLSPTSTGSSSNVLPDHWNNEYLLVWKGVACVGWGWEGWCWFWFLWEIFEHVKHLTCRAATPPSGMDTGARQLGHRSTDFTTSSLLSLVTSSISLVLSCLFPSSLLESGCFWSSSSVGWISCSRRLSGVAMVTEYCSAVRHGRQKVWKHGKILGLRPR